MGKQQSEEILALQWDKLLRIKTTGRDDSMADQYRYPYEPTPYSVLERLAGSGYISKRNVLLDYGCGKGRVDFYLSYQTRCRTMGIEYDPRMYERALSNQLYFYYPSDEYVAYLMTQELLMFVDEIDCGDLFEGKDPREKILIFEIM